MLGLAVVLIIILTYRFLWEKKTRVAPTSLVKSGRTPEQHPDLILKDMNKLLTASNQETQKKDVQKHIKSSLKKDLFFPTISLHKKETLSKKGEENEDNRIENAIKKLKLKATIINNKKPIAIINNKIVGIGEYIMGFKVVDIKDGVIFLSNGKKRVSLNMKGKDNETLQ